MRYCINCGNQLENERFCTQCGADNGAEVNSAPVNNTDQNALKKYSAWKKQNMQRQNQKLMANPQKTKMMVMIIGGIGWFFFLISNWLPWIKAEDPYKIVSITESAWRFFHEEDGMYLLLYFGILCTIVCGVLLFTCIYFPAMIFSILSILPILLVIWGVSQTRGRSGYVQYHYQIGFWLAIISWLLLYSACIAGIRMKKLQKSNQSYAYQNVNVNSTYNMQADVNYGAPTVQSINQPIPNPVAIQKGKVQCVSGEYAGAMFEIADQEQVMLGCDASVCRLIFSDSTISRKHCLIQYNAFANHYIVTDYSTNGVSVNGNLLNKNVPTALEVGTIIQLGNTDNRLLLS